MTETTRQPSADLQASAPDVPIGLSRAGVTGVQKAVRIGRGAQEKLIAATIDCTVDLDPSQKGVHMSRFPELFEEAIEGVVADEAFLVEDLAEHVAARIVERQDAVVAEVQIRARYPYERTTPVTGLSTQEMVTLIGIAAASRDGVRRIVGVEAVGINACPCAQGLVRGQATERLRDAGFDTSDVERILQLVPLATHNQRGQGTLLVGTSHRVNAERLVELVEGSMSSPIYELLKRPDELFVVEHAHLQPRFVEDSVRVALKSVLDEVPDLDDADFVLSRQVNFETIHAHEVVAERYGTIGELRAELAGGAHGPLRHSELRDWLRKLAGFRLRAARTAAPRRARGGGGSHGAGRAPPRPRRRRRRSPATGSRRARPRAAARATRRSTRPTRSASARRRASQTPAPMPPTIGATPRNAPPVVATILPPFRKRRKRGRKWPSIAAAPVSTPTPWPAIFVATSAGTKPLAVSRKTAGRPSRRPCTRQTFVAPMFPLPCVRMSSPRKMRTSQ